jgi:hypothetical protein
MPPIAVEQISLGAGAETMHEWVREHVQLRPRWAVYLLGGAWIHQDYYGYPCAKGYVLFRGRLIQNTRQACLRIVKVGNSATTCQVKLIVDYNPVLKASVLVANGLLGVILVLGSVFMCVGVAKSIGDHDWMRMLHSLVAIPILAGIVPVHVCVVRFWRKSARRDAESLLEFGIGLAKASCTHREAGSTNQEHGNTSQASSSTHG